MMRSVGVPVMRMRLMAMLLAPCRNGDPQPEADQREAGCRIDGRAVTFGCGSASDPDYNGDGER